jgi:sec-independent protein translocase protein TatA
MIEWVFKFPLFFHRHPGESAEMNLGLVELVIILAILFFIFGGRKIPQISRGFGLAIRNFRKGLHEPDAIDVTPEEKNSGKS